MTIDKATIQEVAEKALEIMEAHEIGAEMDAGFDAGEWSGPAHGRMEEQEIAELAATFGFTYDQVMDEIITQCNQRDAAVMDAGTRTNEDDIGGRGNILGMPIK